MFEFYFQSGEFEAGASSWFDFFTQILASLIGVFGALVIFKMQGKKEARSIENNKIRFENDKLIYLNQLIRNSTRYSSSLINGLKGQIDGLKGNPTEIGAIRSGVENDLVRVVRIINQEDYFHAYKNRTSNNDIIHAFSSLDIINKIRENNFAVFEKYQFDFHYKRTETFIASTMKLSNMIDESMLSSFDDLEKIKEFKILIKFNRIMKDIKEKNPSDINILYSRFILPFYSIFPEMFDTITRSEELFDLVKNSLKNYNIIVKTNQDFIENVKYDLKIIEEQHTILVSNSNRLILYVRSIGT